MRRYVKPYDPRLRAPEGDHFRAAFARWCVVDALDEVYPGFLTGRKAKRPTTAIVKWLDTGSEDVRLLALHGARSWRRKAFANFVRAQNAGAPSGLCLARVQALDALASCCVFDREHTREGTIASAPSDALRAFKRRKGEDYGREHAQAAVARQAAALEQFAEVRDLFESASTRERLRAHRWAFDPWIVREVSWALDLPEFISIRRNCDLLIAQPLDLNSEPEQESHRGTPNP